MNTIDFERRKTIQPNLIAHNGNKKIEFSNQNYITI